MFLALCSVGCEQQNAFVAPPPPEVTVAQPLLAPVAETIEFTGTLEPRQTVEIRARVTGYLQRVAFEDGASVQEGDLLFVIEQEPFEADVESAEAALQKAEAGEQLAKANLQRALQLKKDSAIAEQEVDAANAEVATAAANVKSSQAALKKAKLDLGYTEIRAPISGRIGRHLVDVGNLINKEQTPLAVIENIDPIYAYFNVSEAVLLRFMALVRDKKLPDPAVTPPAMSLALQNDTDFPHQGHLDYTDLGVDPSTGTIRRRAIFPNPDRQLLPGLFVRLQAEIGDPVPKFLVEERAICRDQRGDYLLVVNDENVVEYRPVRLGAQTDSLRVVETGIDTNDSVVVNGLQRARPGSEVQPQRTEMTGTLTESNLTRGATSPEPNIPAPSDTSVAPVEEPADQAPAEQPAAPGPEAATPQDSSTSEGVSSSADASSPSPSAEE